MGAREGPGRAQGGETNNDDDDDDVDDDDDDGLRAPWTSSQNTLLEPQNSPRVGFRAQKVDLDHWGQVVATSGPEGLVLLTIPDDV